MQPGRIRNNGFGVKTGQNPVNDQDRTGKKVLLFLVLEKISVQGDPVQCGNYEGDPLSPPKGGAAQGEHPLTPAFQEVLKSTF
jgi:hypothetical protein